jgi:hypothetical protein
VKEADSKQGAELPWTQPTWLPEVESWVRAELERQGIALRGPLTERQLRPWSAVLSAPTSAGEVYFKATAPSLAHEPALTELLARRWPELLPPVLASDQSRGWLLLADAGVTLRSLVNTAADLHHWERILPRYAELQIALSGERDDLLALGALDRRLSTLPVQYEALLHDTDALRIGLSDGLTADEHARLVAFVPQFAARCAELASYGLPETLHHDDFHDGNIFVHDDRYALADWGESCVAHPFSTLLVNQRSIAYRLGFLGEETTRPETTRLRDAYLEPWSSYAPRTDLLAACALARQLAMVGRALTWHHVISRLAEPHRSQEADAVPGWLQEFLGCGLVV